MYLHCTLSCALELICTSTPFFAVHQYFPESFLLVSKVSVSPVPTVIPSLIHFMFGIGLPFTVQWKVLLSPSFTVWSTGVFMKLGGTATNYNWLKYQAPCIIHYLQKWNRNGTIFISFRTNFGHEFQTVWRNSYFKMNLRLQNTNCSKTTSVKKIVSLNP